MGTSTAVLDGDGEIRPTQLGRSEIRAAERVLQLSEFLDNSEKALERQGDAGEW